MCAPACDPGCIRCDATLSRTWTPHAAATSAAQCVCAPGAWRRAWPRDGGGACAACPEGAACAGGGALPVARAGFWLHRDELELAVESPAWPRIQEWWRCAGGAWACEGGDVLDNVTARCAEGYHGPRCSVCAAHRFGLGPFCVDCPGPLLQALRTCTCILARELRTCIVVQHALGWPLQAVAASAVVLWPPVLLAIAPRAGSLVVVVEACQLLL